MVFNNVKFAHIFSFFSCQFVIHNFTQFLIQFFNRFCSLIFPHSFPCIYLIIHLFTDCTLMFALKFSHIFPDVFPASVSYLTSFIMSPILNLLFEWIAYTIFHSCLHAISHANLQLISRWNSHSIVEAKIKSIPQEFFNSILSFNMNHVSNAFVVYLFIQSADLF